MYYSGEFYYHSKVYHLRINQAGIHLSHLKIGILQLVNMYLVKGRRKYYITTFNIISSIIIWMT